MKILFIHRNFPAQFRHLAMHLGENPKNKVVYLTNAKESFLLKGINKVIYELHREVKPETHHYMRFLEESVLHGQGALRKLIALKASGFNPDVIMGHSWGPLCFVKDVYPDVPFIAHIEWFYNSKNSDVDFIKEPDIDTKAKIRVKNSHLLIDLYSCDRAITSTKWQLSQIPPEFHNKVSVIHEGIDTNYFVPNKDVIFKFGDFEFSQKHKVITYATRGMEPYRGFPEFMEAAAIIQKKISDCHIIIAGDDRVCYGSKSPDGRSYKELMLEKYYYDISRIHFTGSLPYSEYLKLLQVSSVHVYLTYPFVLSWSMLEAMSVGCLLLASNTLPIKEVVEDGCNGFLFDFFSPGILAEKIEELLKNRENYSEIRENARKTIIRDYDLNDSMTKQFKLIEELTKSGSVVNNKIQKNLSL